MWSSAGADKVSASPKPFPEETDYVIGYRRFSAGMDAPKRARYRAELAEFSALLARAEPFVLMTDRSVGDEEQEHDRDARTRSRCGSAITVRR